MNKITYSQLTVNQKEKVCELVKKVNDEAFESFNNLDTFFSGDLFNKGDSFLTFWEAENIIATIGIVTKDIIYKNEVFILEINIEEYNIFKIKTIFEEAESFINSYKPKVIKLLISVNKKNYIQLIEEQGYKKSFSIIVMSYILNDNYSYQEIPAILTERLSFSNKNIFREINNSSFWDSPNEAILSEEETLDLIKTYQDSDLAGIFIFEEKEIGIFELSLEDKKGIINTICISPKFQGNGSGKLLLKFVIQKLMSYGIQEIELKVLSTNIKAMSMYLDFGFKAIDISKIWFEKK